jgi:O-antigen ligase
MMKRELENRLSFILAWGALAVTIVITDRVNTDPANIGKMLLLVVLAFSVLPIIFVHMKDLLRDSRVILFASAGLIMIMTVSIFTSANPIERGLYGAFGRNTGLLAYTSLIIIFLTSTLISQYKNFQRVINALLIAGIVNIVLVLLAASGNDPLTWENPYGAALGTFGNPNFISAFMGILFSVLMVHVLDHNISTRFKLLFLGLLPFVALIIYLSRSLQGILIAAFGSVLALYFFIRSKEKYARATLLYLGGSVILGLLVLAGILNKGPLAPLLYSYTVKLRSEYWKAGINMGMENPLTGVGIDSYGIYYRSFRELSATVSPGVGVTTDSAHNVYIDIFSGVGFPGLVTYLIINGFVLFIALKHLRETKEFDGRFLTLFLGWAAYQLQSIISINQLGLAVWGWLLGGLTIAYTRVYSSGAVNGREGESKSRVTKKRPKEQDNQLLDASSLLKILCGALIGLLIALPPFVSDVKMRNFFSNKQGTAESVIALAESWPVDNIRLNKIVLSLARNNQGDQARELAAFAALKFPRDYVSWWTLDQLTREDTPEKEFLRNELHKIDPFNPAHFKK